LLTNRRVRVTARSRRNEGLRKETLSSIQRWQHPLQIVNSNWHRSKSLPQECEWKQGESAVVKLGTAAGIQRLPLVGGQPHR
jgi:hypothetical protein